MCRRWICLLGLVAAIAMLLPTTSNGALIGAWMLDEGSGSTATDSSGNGHDGVINNTGGGLGTGGAVWYTDPELGTVLSFSGDDSAGAYVDAGMIIPPMTLTNDFTWSFWAKQSGDGGGVNKTMLGNRYGASDELQFCKFTPTNFEFYNNGNTTGFIDYVDLPADVWVHHAVVKTGATFTYYRNGVASGTSTTTTTLVQLPFYMGGNASGERWRGWLSDVHIYDNALSAADIVKLAMHPWASAPNPADAGTVTNTTVALTWAAGAYAATHQVYFSDDLQKVEQRDPSVAKCLVAEPDIRRCFVGRPPDAPLVKGTTYYWCVDEANDVGPAPGAWAGHIWSFTVKPQEAWMPHPAENTKYTLTSGVTLSWNAGAASAATDVYFGTDPNALVFKTEIAHTEGQDQYSYTIPEQLDKDTVYYWRCDEWNQSYTDFVTGNTWSFTTVPDVAVTDPNLLGWWKLDEGSGEVAVDYSGHENYGVIHNPDSGLGADGSVWDDDAEQGMVASFNGDDSTGAYISTANMIPALDLTDDFTWTFWAKRHPDQPTVIPGSGNDVVVGNRYGGTASPVQFVKFTSGRFEYYNAALNGVIDYDDLPADIWVHCAVVKTGDTFTYYRDGQVADTSVTTATMDPNPFYMGGDAQGERWEGRLCNVRVYDRALSDQEVLQTMRTDLKQAWNPGPSIRSVPQIEEAGTLTWSSGDGATDHDVYFGTDRDTVANADTTTMGVYRGRQSFNSYSPAEGVDFGQTYYWRIDEISGSTTTTGRVWTFTVQAYRVVDDFESYGDLLDFGVEGQRIWFVWWDGFGYLQPVKKDGNGSGSVVDRSTTIIDSGYQAMSMTYSGNSWVQAMTADLPISPDWTAFGTAALNLRFRGYRASMGGFSSAGAGQYNISSGEGDIWDVADTFHFAYVQMDTGVSEIIAKVDSLTAAHAFAKCGVMVRDTLDAGSAHAFMAISPGNGAAFQWRPTADATSLNVNIDAGTAMAPVWLRIQRNVSGQASGSYSLDGSTWTPVWGPNNVTVATPMYAGVAISANAEPTGAQAVFSNVTINGNSYSNFQDSDIGVVANTPDNLYVELSDGVNTKQVLRQDNPNAILNETWQDWDIALSEFSPVNPANIQSIKIGVTGAGGGTGTIFVDNIRLYAPRCVPSKARLAADFNGNCTVDEPDLLRLVNDWLFEQTGNGVNYDYYIGDWLKMPDFDYLTPVAVGTADDFNINGRLSDTYFAFVFTGFIDIATAGDYTFYTESDDGSMLYIDDALLVDNDYTHGMTEVSGTVNLSQGLHAITVKMFQRASGFGLNVRYEGPGIEKQVIPNEVLYRDSSPVDLNGDGNVDFKDFALLADFYLNTLLWPQP